ncbi:hypothetical protein CBR_g392 [Chara braunii]|uniref:Uncharacterized protein n=1 Tax=Chara braunii TaxID=69332 RepID=A0A388JQK5_CHABU|nr:hypothetical protein CBR_g392 [Chara braunii]|eukprot:GBG60061.1 hypothetical protein CBR_g392 [Chara braunii]
MVASTVVKWVTGRDNCSSDVLICYHRPPVATGANAEPLLALPAANSRTAAGSQVTSASTYSAQPRTGSWTQNQQILDKCNTFISRAEQKERDERAAKERLKKQREKEEAAVRLKKEREDFKCRMGQRLESRVAPMYDAIMGKGVNKTNSGSADEEVPRQRWENEEMRAKYGIVEQLPSTNLVDRLQKENNDIKKAGDDLKTRLENDMAALKWEIRDLKNHHESVGRSNLTKQIDELRSEIELLHKRNEETEEVAQLWRSEALRPGNKRGSINMSTPASKGRTVTRSQLGGGPDEEARRLCGEVQDLHECRRCDQTEVDMLKERCAKAEAQRMDAEV